MADCPIQLEIYSSEPRYVVKLSFDKTNQLSPHSGRDSLGTTSLRVTLGEHDLLDVADPQLPVSRFVLHPDFRCGRYDSDLALLKLEGTVPWSASVLPACFPSSRHLEESPVTVAGWGWTHEISSQGA